jgi:hypothetical protein
MENSLYHKVGNLRSLETAGDPVVVGSLAGTFYGTDFVIDALFPMDINFEKPVWVTEFCVLNFRIGLVTTE